jgi:hypothetical protein
MWHRIRRVHVLALPERPQVILPCVQHQHGLTRGVLVVQHGTVDGHAADRKRRPTRAARVVLRDGDERVAHEAGRVRNH